MDSHHRPNAYNEQQCPHVHIKKINK
uniref:Uncharacterized protein n=1 Tax=Anguilla anguilla TaxID=7936 RepID=A0A0E9UUX4_ANGAN